MSRSSFSQIDCGVAQAAEQIGDKWTLVILRNAFQGMSRFDEFSEHLGIAANVLSDRLNRLAAADILYRRPASQDGRAVEYKLTPKGFELFPLVVFLNQWGERWLGKPEGLRVELCDKSSGRPIRAVAAFAEDGRKLTAQDAVSRPGSGGSEVLRRAREIIARRRPAAIG